jgi:hypothetical protein
MVLMLLILAVQVMGLSWLSLLLLPMKYKILLVVAAVGRRCRRKIACIGGQRKHACWMDRSKSSLLGFL